MTEVNKRDFTGLEDVAQLIEGDDFYDNKIEIAEFDTMISLIDSERERDILKNELDTRDRLDTLREEVIEHFVREMTANKTTAVQELFAQIYQENPDSVTLKEIADRVNFETEDSLYQRNSDKYEREVWVDLNAAAQQENEDRGKYASYMLELMEIELDTVYRKRGLREDGSTDEHVALKPLSSIIDDMLLQASTITLNHNRSNLSEQVGEPKGIDILMNTNLLYNIDEIAFDAIKTPPSYIPQGLQYSDFQTYKYIKKVDDDGKKKYENSEEKRKANLYKATVPLIATIKSKILMDAIQNIIHEKQLGAEGGDKLLAKYIAELQGLKGDIGSGIDGFFSDTRYELMLEYLQDAQGTGEFDYQGQMQRTTTTLLDNGFNAFTGNDNSETRANLLYKKEEVLLDSGLFDQVPINFLHYKMPEVKLDDNGLPIGLPTIKGEWHQKPNTIEEFGKERTGENENARTYWRHVSHDGVVHVELLVYYRQLDNEGKPNIVDEHEVWDSVGAIDYISDGSCLKRTSAGELHYNETNGEPSLYRNIYYPTNIKLLSDVSLTDVIDESSLGLVTAVDVPEEYYQDEGYSPERPTENPETNPGGLNILKPFKEETPENIDHLEEFNQTASEVVFDIVSEFKKGSKIVSRRDSIDHEEEEVNKVVQEFSGDADLASYIGSLHNTIRAGVVSRSPQANGQNVFRSDNMEDYMELIGKACSSLSLNERNLEADLGEMKDQQLLALKKIEAGSYFHTYSAIVLEKNAENPAKIQESMPGGSMRSVNIDIHQMLNDDFDEIMKSFEDGLAVDASAKDVEAWVLEKMSKSHNGTIYPEISSETFEERNSEKRELHTYLYEKQEKELPKQNRELLCSRMSSLLMKDLCLGLGPKVEELREAGDLRSFGEAAEGLSEYNHMQTFEQRKVVRDIVKEVGKEVLILAVSGGLLGAVAKGATRGYRAYKLSSMITIAEQGVFVSRWSKIAKFVGTTLYQGVGFTVLPSTFHHMLGDITDEQLKDQLTNKWSYIHSTIMMGTLGAIKLGGGVTQAIRQRGVITNAENTLARTGGKYVYNPTIPRLIGTATLGTEYVALLGFQSFSMTTEAEEQMLQEFNEKYKHISDPQAKAILRAKFFLEPLAIMGFLGVQNIKLRRGERMKSLETIAYDKTDPRKSTYKYTIVGSDGKRTYKRDGKTKKMSEVKPDGTEVLVEGNVQHSSYDTFMGSLDAVRARRVLGNMSKQNMNKPAFKKAIKEIFGEREIHAGINKNENDALMNEVLDLYDIINTEIHQRDNNFSGIHQNGLPKLEISSLNAKIRKLSRLLDTAGIKDTGLRSKIINRLTREGLVGLKMGQALEKIYGTELSLEGLKSYMSKEHALKLLDNIGFDVRYMPQTTGILTRLKGKAVDIKSGAAAWTHLQKKNQKIIAAESIALKSENVHESDVSLRKAKVEGELDFFHIEVNKGTSRSPLRTKLVLPFKSKSEVAEFLNNPNWKKDLVFTETNALEGCIVALPKGVYTANGISTTPGGGQYILGVRTLGHSVWSSVNKNNLGYGQHERYSSMNRADRRIFDKIQTELVGLNETDVQRVLENVYGKEGAEYLQAESAKQTRIVQAEMEYTLHQLDLRLQEEGVNSLDDFFKTYNDQKSPQERDRLFSILKNPVDSYKKEVPGRWLNTNLERKVDNDGATAIGLSFKSMIGKTPKIVGQFSFTTTTY